MLKMRTTILSKVVVIFAVLLICFVAYINFQQLTEAFGSGPPYYSRTTNMDKWTNPIPYLLIIDLMTIGIIYLMWTCRSRRQTEHQIAKSR